MVFNSRNKIWDINANNNSRMSLILEGIINCHGLYMATNTDFTYQQSTLVSNPWSQKHQSCNKKIYLNKNKAQSY